MTKRARNRLVCPHCGSTRIMSSEQATIDYPVVLYLNMIGDVEMDYTGEDRIVHDEGTQCTGDYYCRECAREFRESEALTRAEYAHRGYPPGDIQGIEEDSDRGSDIRYQAVCYASHDGWSCDWCSVWQHADSFDDGESSHPVEGRLDPAQLAYNAAEALMKDHLREWGVVTDQDDAGTTAEDTHGAATDVAAVGPAEGVAPRG